MKLRSFATVWSVASVTVRRTSPRVVTSLLVWHVPVLAPIARRVLDLLDKEWQYSSLSILWNHTVYDFPPNI